MENAEAKQILYEEEDAIAPLAEEVSHTVFTHPELGDEEVFTSAYLADQAEKAGFRVTRSYLGLPTSFRAEYGDAEGPTIAFPAEYDALPGYGPEGKDNGHACGHNWIAASTFAAALALKNAKDRIGFQGRIVYLGTPAEENTSRKITLIDRGAFNDIDCVYQMHLGEETRTDSAALAMTILWYEFYGVASHASGAPENGVNALDAVMLTFAGINALRQHLKDDVRIHGVVREGGAQPNIVPDHTKMEIYIRSADKDYLEEVIEKVNNCARGASLMTGARVEIIRDQYTTYNIKNNSVMVGLLEQNMRDSFGIEPVRHANPYQNAGSSDIGNVSYTVPTCYTYMGTGEYSSARTHEEAFLDVADSEYAHRQLHIGAKLMAASALDIYLHPELLEAARAEFVR